ncbi:acetyl-CoA carboxylase biotin carboxylase subunit [Natranaerobius thermophilus]|uniref:Biotin carboxylase n=1 Tax=Natranaerobius thermophilus (strain ATCC BAA-1301 / DSM 18059 / JW/NM-WN-LF) TaxID=457570 RepID=B2A864_NATTJ|nr:acetyl-CoA carboxylase biotin carboxylase subunit [Natranaerobius thermophilus]ACB84430.1 acetyl-coenzyme A carboxylase carboxyl transferase subunit alpha, biotin carboxylase [Natranaerobius thermophilus JW/NM-WN-LF]
MFNKILVANRGEIAVRIIRACREMGIETVAVYSTVDEEALHVQMADESVCIGTATDNCYTNISRILTAAEITDAEAIHPGFGFLSENSRFADVCRKCNITFIGPRPEVIENMGNKSNARKLMANADVPVVPGSKKPLTDEQDAVQMADELGYPVMIKASAGGGGRGIRIIRSQAELLNALGTAKQEAATFFGDDTMYMEKYLEKPRHVEIQILADKYGNVLHLGERDCSIQRRNQKVLEEAPCPVMTEELREKMGQAAVRAAKYVGYQNAGTIEFLLDKHNNFYFMEMNTRIQVEHPVTEQIVGLDLIKEQIKIAAGQRLEKTQEEINLNGHSIECRINAEDPQKNFMPCPGKVNGLFIPSGLGVRVDSLLYDGYEIPSTYDSMIAKLIVHGKDREEAINKMKRALGEFVILGVKNNVEFHLNILNNDDFVKGIYDTNFINDKIF